MSTVIPQPINLMSVYGSGLDVQDSLNSKNNTNKHVGLLFLTVSLIQLVEIMMRVDQACG